MEHSLKNTLLVMHGAGTGGVEKSLRILSKYVDRNRYRMIVAIPSDGPMKSHLDLCGIETIITPLDTWTPISFDFGERHYYQFLSILKERVEALVGIIRERQIDVVHSATLSVADGAFAARIAGIPHLWHIHGKSVGTTDAYGSYLPVQTLYAMVNDLSDSVVAVSHDVRQFLESYLHNVNIPVVWNGLDIQEFDEQVQGPSIRDELHVKDRDKLVVLVGRIAHVKGIDVFIEAAVRVLGQFESVSFLIVGGEEDRHLAEKLKAHVGELGIENKILFWAGGSTISPRFCARLIYSSAPREPRVIATLFSKPWRRQSR